MVCSGNLDRIDTLSQTQRRGERLPVIISTQWKGKCLFKQFKTQSSRVEMGWESSVEKSLIELWEDLNSSCGRIHWQTSFGLWPPPQASPQAWTGFGNLARCSLLLFFSRPVATCLQCVFSHVSSSCLPGMIQTHIGCICKQARNQARCSLSLGHRDPTC